MNFDEWFRSKQGLSYDSMFLFARDAWDAAKAVEREECAKICEENCAGYSYGRDKQGPCLTEFPKESGGRHDGMTYADAIRARK